MGLTQGLQATLVAATAPADLRGTAFGMFNLMPGVVLLLASVVAGLLWSRLGPSATFVAGAIFTAVALGGLGLIDHENPLLPPGGDMLKACGGSTLRPRPPISAR